MLALSVTASLWSEGLICAEILEKNLCCICLSPSMINLSAIQDIVVEMPQIKSILHSIVAKDDFIPRLTMFIDQENEDFCSDILNYEELDLLSKKVCPFACLF